ncbi:hypothetical protein [Paracoccus zhouxuedongae]|uniref:hypothetical protein n=1 Tax=unclassified Paracoccus (in: a-proteobacteria) TaxID=2688777 RepID=UPI0035B9CA7F
MLRTLLVALAMLALALPLWDGRAVAASGEAQVAVALTDAPPQAEAGGHVEPAGACLTGAPCGPDLAPPPPDLHLPPPPGPGQPRAEGRSFAPKALTSTPRRPPRLI